MLRYIISHVINGVFVFSSMNVLTLLEVLESFVHMLSLDEGVCLMFLFVSS